MSRLPRLAAAALLAPILLCGGCKRTESVEEARARSQERFLEAQVADLKKLVARAESGDLVTKDRLAIGIAEQAVKSFIDASLPQEQLLGGRVTVRIESAQAYFRGNNAALVFAASARGKTGLAAKLELGGRLAAFRIDGGVLKADVVLAHFKVLEAPGGDLASDLLEKLAKDHADELTKLIPRVELPVSLKQAIEIPGLEEGVVTVKAGVLPLEIAVAETIPVNERLWVLLEVKAGPWRKAAPQTPASPATASPATPPSKATPAAAKPSPPAKKPS